MSNDKWKIARSATARGSDTKSLHECCRQVHRQSADRQSSSQGVSRRVVTKSSQTRRFDCSSKYSSLKSIASCDIALDDFFFRKSIEVIHYSERVRNASCGDRMPSRLIIQLINSFSFYCSSRTNRISGLPAKRSVDFSLHGIHLRLRSNHAE